MSGLIGRGRYGSEILAREPPEWVEEADWEAVEKSAETPIPADTTYTLTWDSPRRPGLTITTVISVKNAPKPPPPSG